MHHNSIWVTHLYSQCNKSYENTVICLHRIVAETLNVNMEQCLGGSLDKVKDLIIQNTHTK